MDFGRPLGDSFLGYVTVEFKDTFGIVHSAQQAGKIVAGQLATTDAIEWTCTGSCRVHVVRPTPPPGRLTRLARRLKLY